MFDDLSRALRGAPDVERTIIARRVENVSKLALIRAISREPRRPEITAVDLQWAGLLVDHCQRPLLRDADRYIADNQIEANHKKVLEIIRQERRIGKSALCRRTQFVLGRERDQIIQTLIDAQSIAKEEIKSGKHTTVFYRVLKRPK